MKNFCLSLFVIFSFSTAYAQEVPIADNGAVVLSGEVRFTILTPELIRMEWSQSKTFEDHATQVFINRKLIVPSYTSKERNGWLIINTDKLELIYKIGSGKFNPNNLVISYTLNGEKKNWKPGMTDSLNLKGTTRTLDGWNGGKLDRMEAGLISQSGYSLIDDSRSLVFDNSDWPWIMQRNDTLCQDWYFFGYGHEYKKALKDYTTVAGKIPMPPRFAFGNWWSRYWVYSDRELRDLVGQMKVNKVPLDVLIIDMDWHNTYGLNWEDQKKDSQGEMLGWTGFTWNKNLFPDPSAFLTWTEQQGLKTALNLHPASGVPSMEEQYEPFAKAYWGEVPKDRPYVPFEMENKKFAQLWFDVLLKPLRQQGVDFWWLDWQQWLEAKKMKGLSNTWWLNYTVFTHMERQGERPILFHRWGGLGNHRYQIGFSGDTYSTWKSLAFQPWFTATASNVGYGYWSHDIGGHMPGVDPTDPELYLRWLQFGALSPVLRTHATKSNLVERRIWMFPEYTADMRNAIKLRYALFPYIYTASRKAYDDGISICRPMYYEYPESKEAYIYKGQYCFGDDIIVAPVCSPIEKANGLATVRFWLPPGDWYEWSTGFMLKGGTAYARNYSLSEIPMFVKAGSILPMTDNLQNLQGLRDTLVLTVIPGGVSKNRLYEDDGTTSDYKTDKFAFTNFFTEFISDKELKLTVSPRQGYYNGVSPVRAYEIRFLSILPPEKITVNDVEYSFSQEYKQGSWSYDASTLCVKVFISAYPCNEGLRVSIGYSEKIQQALDFCEGMQGRFNRMEMAIAYLKEAAQGDRAIPDSIYHLEETLERIQYNPMKTSEEIRQFRQRFIGKENSLFAFENWDPTFTQKGTMKLYYTASDSALEPEENNTRRLKAIAERVSIKYPYSTDYPGVGPATLFDGKTARLNYYDDNWQGYFGPDLEVIYDLGEKKDLTRLASRYLQNVPNWIFLPQSVEYFVSDDGKTFRSLGKIENTTDPHRKDVFIQEFSLDFVKTNVRYIKVIARSKGTCPDWHQAKGNKAWLFVDEICIN